jgi:hypothetical protein
LSSPTYFNKGGIRRQGWLFYLGVCSELEAREAQGYFLPWWGLISLLIGGPALPNWFKNCMVDFKILAYFNIYN